MAATTIDGPRLEAFMGQAVVDLAAAFSAPLVRLGARLGLYRALARGRSRDADSARRANRERAPDGARVARQSGRRRLRELRRATGRYTHPAGAGDRARRRGERVYLLGAYDILASFFADEDRLAEAFGAAAACRGASTITACSPERRCSSVPVQAAPRAELASRARRRGSEARGGGARGGRRLRPRRLDDHHGRGLPRLVVRGL